MKLMFGSECWTIATLPATLTMRRWLYAFTRALSTTMRHGLPKWRRRFRLSDGIRLCGYLDFATKTLMPFVARFAIFRSCGRCVCSVPVPGGLPGAPPISTLRFPARRRRQPSGLSRHSCRLLPCLSNFQGLSPNRFSATKNATIPGCTSKFKLV